MNDCGPPGLWLVLTLLGAMVLLAVGPWSRPWLPGWMVVVILARELLVSAIRSFVEGEGGEFPADRWGKLKMVLQCLAVGGLGSVGGVIATDN